MITNNTNRRIVVGVDGSEPSKHALRWARRLADDLDASIEAITVWDTASTYGWTTLPLYEPEVIQKTLDATVDDVFGDERPDGLTAYTRMGTPASVLIEASRGALMVVVGSRGRGGFAGLLIGSVSAKVAEHATCPVLVVHGDPADRP